MTGQTIVLVTGANKGIGYEIAAGLGAVGWNVGVGARDEASREAAVEKLRGLLAVEVVPQRRDHPVRQGAE